MNKLRINNKCIPFEAKDIQGNLIKLSDYKEQKVLLTFFRKASCPFCNMNLQGLIKNYSKFEDRGIKIIVLFASSLKDVEKYAGKQNPPFPIIPDGEFNIYKKYGVDKSFIGMFKAMLNPKKVFKALTGGFFSLKPMIEEPVIPADFLIDENPYIYKAYYGKDFDDHIPIEDVLAWKK